MKTVMNNEGFIKPLLIIALLVALVYAGFQFAMPYYKYSALKADVKEMARISLGREDRLKTMIFRRIDELKLPIPNDSVFVQRRGETMHVSISWTVRVDLMGLYQKDIDFNIDVDE